MGNQLCAPWRKVYQDDENHWTPRKDSHLLRLWAEIFEVQEEDGEICWGKVSDDVVPVNITCIQNQPLTVFQITAYNRHVEKIFDVRLSQPGTRITQASECFVHWKDSKLDHEWGLNFTSPLDARRFRECCSRNYGRKSVSNPTSPVAQPRRAISSPEELAGQDNEGSSIYTGGALKVEDLSHYSQVSGIATAPRVHRNARHYSQCQSMYSTMDNHALNGSNSHCENIYSQISRQQRLQDSTSEECSHHYNHQNIYSSTMHQPIAEREIPCTQYISSKSSTTMCNIYVTSQQMKPGAFSYTAVKPDQVDHAANNFNIGHNRASSVGRYVHNTMQNDDCLLTSTENSKLVDSKSEYFSRSLRDLRDSPINRETSEMEISEEMKYVNKMNNKTTPKMSGIELRQFSREPTVLNFASVRFEDDSTKPDLSDSSLVSQVAKQLRNSAKKMAKSYNQLASSEEEDEDEEDDDADVNRSETLTLDQGKSLQHFSTSESLPVYSNTVSSLDGLFSVGFDSNTLKRMLQILPEASPIDQINLRSKYILGSPVEAVKLTTSSVGTLLSTSCITTSVISNQTEIMSTLSSVTVTCDLIDASSVTTTSSSITSTSSKSPMTCYGYSVSDLRAKFMESQTATTVQIPSTTSSSITSISSELSSTNLQQFSMWAAENMATHVFTSTSLDNLSAYAAGDINECVSFESAEFNVSSVSNTHLIASTSLMASSLSSSHPPVVTAIKHPIMSTPLIDSSHQTVHFSTVSSNLGPSQHLHKDLQHELTSQSSFSSPSSSAVYSVQAETECAESGISNVVLEEKISKAAKAKSSVQSDLLILPYETQAMFASRSTSIRKTGCLMVQNMLTHKMSTVLVSPHRAWGEYFVCLKGTLMLFFASEEEARRTDGQPCHVLVISGCLAYPDEKSHVEGLFSLSTIFGNAYLFKASSTEEMFSWIINFHLACAACLARNLNRENVCKLLKNEIHKLENSIDLDLKMKKMAGMQANMVNDVSMKQVLDRQMNAWDENLERLYMEQFQLRCYLAAVQDTELPVDEPLLTNMSKVTKTALANLGIESATSFHTAVCSRVPLTMTANLCLSKKSHQSQGMSTFKADTKSKPPRCPRPLSFHPGPSVENDGGGVKMSDELKSTDNSKTSGEPTVQVNLPDGQIATVGLNDKTTFQELLECITAQCHLSTSVYFIRIKLPGDGNFKIPDKSAFVLSEDHLELELCAKLLFQIEIVRNWKERDLGFTVECKEDSKNEEELCVVIADVAKSSASASRKGLQAGDELLVLNGMMVSELDMVFIESVLEESELVTLTLRSCRCIERTCQNLIGQDDYILDQHCIPLPQDQTTFDQSLSSLEIVCTNNNVNDLMTHYQEVDKRQSAPSFGNPIWVVDAKPSAACLNDHQTASSLILSRTTEEEITKHSTSKSMSDDEKMCKVILELIETERQYVQDLNCLIDWYLEPLKNERITGSDEIEQLFGNIQEIVHFQKMFLQSLESAVDKEIGPNTNPNKENIHFKKILLALGSAFLYYAHHFKLYSSFCASHSKAQKILLSDNNIPLQDFLKSHNPMQQHSVALESYLIKPIQRILKYPLLLKQLKDLTDQSSEEHAHLREALHGMEAVAEHINEMQKIYEEYGNILDELSKQYKENNPHSRSLDLNVGELQMYGTVNWLNATSELGKLKKGMELLTLLFIFRSGVVLMAQEKVKGKRKVKGRLAPSLGDATNGGLGSGGAKYKTAIPVDQLQVRTMVGDAHECHGIWEMIHCGSEYEVRSEKIYQFASSQEARRDFIRTIHFSIRESIQQPKPVIYDYANDRFTTAEPKKSTNTGQQGNCGYHSKTLPDTQTQQKQSNNQRLCQQQVIKSNLKQPSQSRYDNSRATEVLNSSNDSNYSGQIKTSDNRHSYESTTISGSHNRGHPSSSSTRPVHSTHDPSRYFSQTLQHHSRDSQRPGSPVWKPRSGSRCLANQSPMSEDNPQNSTESCNAQSTNTTTSKQRVAFLIPNKYREFEDTDC